MNPSRDPFPALLLLCAAIFTLYGAQALQITVDDVLALAELGMAAMVALQGLVRDAR